MTFADDLPAIFEARLVAAVADDHDVPQGRLASLLADHQASVRNLPGVENLVYEWRRQFDATVVDTTEAAYYVAAPPWVWSEFAESLGATDAEATAMAEVHARHALEQSDEDVDAEDHALVVLDRSG